MNYLSNLYNETEIVEKQLPTEIVKKINSKQLAESNLGNFFGTDFFLDMYIKIYVIISRADANEIHPRQHLRNDRYKNLESFAMLQVNPVARGLSPSRWGRGLGNSWTVGTVACHPDVHMHFTCTFQSNDFQNALKYSFSSSPVTRRFKNAENANYFVKNLLH